MTKFVGTQCAILVAWRFSLYRHSRVFLEKIEIFCFFQRRLGTFFYTFLKFQTLMLVTGAKKIENKDARRKQRCRENFSRKPMYFRL